MLSGARNENNVDLAEKVFARIKEKFPEMNKSSIPASILLANVYARSGQMEKSIGIRNDLNQSGVKKRVGLTWTVINKKIFVS